MDRRALAHGASSVHPWIFRITPSDQASRSVRPASAESTSSSMQTSFTGALTPNKQTPYRRPPDHAPWNLQTASANPQPVFGSCSAREGFRLAHPSAPSPSNDAAYLAHAAACLHHPRRRREARGSRREVAKTPSKPRRVAHLTPDLTARRRRVACSSITHTLHPAQPTSGPQARAHKII